jgi:hypothetical protein
MPILWLWRKRVYLLALASIKLGTVVGMLELIVSGEKSYDCKVQSQLLDLQETYCSYRRLSFPRLSAYQNPWVLSTSAKYAKGRANASYTSEQFLHEAVFLNFGR